MRRSRGHTLNGHGSAPLAVAIPSPPDNGFHVGPAFIHFYGLMYVIGITLAVIITRRRWQARGGDPALVADVATWAVPFGIIGGRIYFDITTPGDIPHHWWGVFAVWSGGLGVWGGIAAGAAAGIWRVRKAHGDVRVFMECIAPALLVAQGIGRIGNYFNQELFGKPSTLPWALTISPQDRPTGYTALQHVPADIPVRAHLRPGAGGAAGVARPPAADPATGAVRAVRDGLLGVPHL